MKPKASIVSAAVSALLLSCLLALSPAHAVAQKTHLYIERLGGTSPPNLRIAMGLTVDQTNGDVLVVDAFQGNEEQLVTFDGFGSGNTFKLTFEGETTGTITFSANAETLNQNIATALAGLGAIGGSSNISVDSFSSNGKTNAIVRFKGALAGFPQELMGCSVEAGSGSCSVAESHKGHLPSIERFKQNGEPDPFSALGGNSIDAAPGRKGKSCAEEPSSCDQTPQGGFLFGTFAGEDEVAIDESGGLTDGDIYVTQGHLGSGNLVDIFAADGHYLGQITAAGATPLAAVGSPCGVAVDANGDLFVGGGGKERVYKFDPSANPPQNSDFVGMYADPGFTLCGLAAGAGPSAGSIFVDAAVTGPFERQGNASVLKLSTSLSLLGIGAASEPRLVSVDPVTGHLYASEVELDANISPINPTVGEYDTSGSQLLAGFPAGNGPGPRGLAVDGDTGRIYVSAGGGNVEVYGPIVTVPDVTTGSASILGDTTVSVSGTVDPDGVALDECFFEYGLTAAYGQIAPCSESPGEIGTSLKAVAAEVSGLTPETAYHYRLVAKNLNAALYPNDPRSIGTGPDRVFKTPSKPAIVRQWAAEAGFNEARLKAIVNPENSATEVHLQWGTDSSYGKQTAGTAIGTEAGNRTVSFFLEGLQPGTTYHYRFVAENGIGTTDGGDRSFTTLALPAPLPNPDPCPNGVFRNGLSAFLPDCRAYEMVSPVDKGDGDIATLLNNGNEPAALDQSSGDGEAFTYSTFRAFGDAQSAPATSQYLARRSESGWTSQGISPPRGISREGTGATLESQFRAFTPDLCHAWLRHDTDPPLTPDGVEHFPNLYAVDLCGGEETYEALTPTEPVGLKAEEDEMAIGGISADGSHVAFRTNARQAVASNPAPVSGTNFQCYDFSGGQLALVSVLPNGSANTTNCAIGTANKGQGFRRGSDTHAVSENGSRIFWTASANNEGPGKIYLRINEKKQTVAVSEAGEGLSHTASEGSRFWAAAADGSKAIYTTGTLGREAAGGAEADLYEFTVSGKVTHLIANHVYGVLGVSDDASRVYFASKDVLSGANAEGEMPLAGNPNLYLYDSAAGGSFSFIGQLSTRDSRAVEFTSAEGVTPLAAEASRHVAQVSPDGSVATFMSTARLTGFDNTDANTGEPDAEVFLYQAEANGGVGRLLCASCNPTGIAPVGHRPELPVPMDNDVAARIAPPVTQTYAPQVLADEGSRLFFSSYEALVPRDTNGVEDVYEWEAPGVGPNAGLCTESSPAYSPPNGGCISLISAGKGTQGSEFLDSAGGGRDVFFTTGAGLLPQDPGLIDIYDAREGGGVPPPREPAAPCQGESCQPAATPPNDPTPASSAFQGPGNVHEAKTKKPKGAKKPKNRKAKKSKAKVKKTSKHRRASK